MKNFTPMSILYPITVKKIAPVVIIILVLLSGCGKKDEVSVQPVRPASAGMPFSQGPGGPPAIGQPTTPPPQ